MLNVKRIIQLKLVFWHSPRIMQLSRFLALLLISLTVFNSAEILPNLAKAEGRIYCEDIRVEVRPAKVKIQIDDSYFTNLLLALRNTLAGNLATVFRSEWKTKLSVAESNQLVYDIAKSYLTPEVFEKITKGLNIERDSFVRIIHKRLYELKDQISKVFSVRDAAPPLGAADTTFTYYTGAIKNRDGEGEGKHQVRVRNYLRTVATNKLSHMPVGHKIGGFSSDGQPFLFMKDGNDLYSFGPPNGSRTTMSLAEIKLKYPNNIVFYAPHGGKFKLEVKTGLLDKILAQLYPSLGGHHMVQKLDVSLTPAQVESLFSGIYEWSALEKQRISYERIDKLEESLKAAQPNQHPRIEAVLDVLRAGVGEDPDYLNIEGATLYHRSAFESSLGFQLTIDRAQGVFVGGQMYAGLELKNPMNLMYSGIALVPAEDAARHVELKLPVHAVQALLGIDYNNPESTGQIPTDAVAAELANSLAIYSLKAVPRHPGKFHYLQDNGIISSNGNDISLVVGD